MRGEVARRPERRSRPRWQADLRQARETGDGHPEHRAAAALSMARVSQLTIAAIGQRARRTTDRGRGCCVEARARKPTYVPPDGAALRSRPPPDEAVRARGAVPGRTHSGSTSCRVEFGSQTWRLVSATSRLAPRQGASAYDSSTHTGRRIARWLLCRTFVRPSAAGSRCAVSATSRWRPSAARDAASPRCCHAGGGAAPRGDAPRTNSERA